MVNIMRRTNISCSHFLFFLIIWILPSIGTANYDHVLYFKQVGKFKLLIAFPTDAPDSSKAVLFSDNDWHLPRYSDSQAIKEFFGALGFKDQSARVKFRRKFQPDAVYDLFTSWNWQAIFNWLSDMRIEDIDKNTILIKELVHVEHDSLAQAYKNRDYFPVLYYLDRYLPKLEIHINNLKTNVIDFGEVEIGTQKKIIVVLTAKNINNSILFINPIYESYLDKSITINKSKKPILLYDEVPDTLEVVFSPSDSITESKFWLNDTLNFFIPLIGDYLPEQVKLLVTGVRIKRTGYMELLLSQYSRSFIAIIVSIIMVGTMFLFYRSVKHKKQKSMRNVKIPQIDFNQNKQMEIVTNKPIKRISTSAPIKQAHFKLLLIKIKNILNQTKPFVIDFYKKNRLSRTDVDLITTIKKLYHNDDADIPEFIKIIQNYFEQNKDENKKLFKALFIDNQKIKERDQIIENLQWYKESFCHIKNLSGIKNTDDFAAKKILIDKICYYDPEEEYNIIEKYCYSPILTHYEKFQDENKPIHENLEIFKKNREKLLNQKKQIEELLLINEEQKYLIEGMKQGYINIKMKTNELENIQIDYEQFIIIQGICSRLIDGFSSFLKNVISQFEKVDRSNTSDCWLKIIDKILSGRSGIAGIKACMERLESLRNPLIILKFFELTTSEKLKKVTKEFIKSKFRDQLILTPFCMPYLQDLRRLYLYLENKELRSNSDEKLFTIVTSLNERLYELFKWYDIYLHQLKLFTKFDQKWNFLAKEPNVSISYLEQTESTKLKLKNLISVGKLSDDYIYDVDFVGYDIISEGDKDKSEDSQVYVYNKLTNAIY